MPNKNYDIHYKIVRVHNPFSKRKCYKSACGEMSLVVPRYYELDYSTKRWTNVPKTSKFGLFVYTDKETALEIAREYNEMHSIEPAYIRKVYAVFECLCDQLVKTEDDEIHEENTLQYKRVKLLREVDYNY